MDNSTILAAICGSPVAWFICSELAKVSVGEWVRLSPTLPGSQYLKARARARLEWLGVAEFRRGWLNWIEGRYTDRAVQVFRVETLYHCRRIKLVPTRSGGWSSAESIGCGSGAIIECGIC